MADTHDPKSSSSSDPLPENQGAMMAETSAQALIERANRHHRTEDHREGWLPKCGCDSCVLIRDLVALLSAQEAERVMQDECEQAVIECAQSWQKRAEAAESKLNHWHRRAQKAEAELCVTAEERNRQGMSIGRGLAGATWQRYKDRAEAAEATLAALETLPQAVHNTAAEWAMVCATLDAEAAGISAWELREAAQVGQAEAP